MSLPHIQLMSRRDCCLCDDAKAVLAAVSERGYCTWETVNVDHDKALMVRFGLDVPVLLADGNIIFKHRVTAEQLSVFLSAWAEASEEKGLLI
jgi:glutaredoxin